MSTQRWLDGYDGQTTDALIALDGDHRTDSIVLAFEQAIVAKADRLGGVEHLTGAERVVLAIEALEREVNNDGYDGLFRNAAREVPDIVAALTAIGSDAVAEITRTAIAALEIDGPLTPEAVDTAIEADDDARDDLFDRLARAYHETAGDLAGPLMSYIAANRDQITLP